MKRRFSPLALLVLGLLSGCGDEPLEHGLEAQELESRPSGEPITVGRDIVAGRRFQGTVRLELDVVRDQHGTQDPGTTRLNGWVRMGVAQAYTRAPGAKDAELTFTLSYEAAEGGRAEHFLALPPTQGRVALGFNARPKPGSLKVTGSPEGEAELRSMLEGLYLAGALGSVSWLPPRAVREGESWSLEEHVRTQALENLERMRKRPDLDLPEPHFQATCRLEEVRVVDGERHLKLHLDALLEVVGETRQDGATGQLAFADRVQGTAWISERYGLPYELDVSHERRHDERSGDASDSMTVRAHWQVKLQPVASSDSAPARR